MTTAKMKYLIGIIIMTCSLMACNKTVENPFVTVVDGHFEWAGKPYYYVGTEEDFVTQLNADLTFLTQFAKDNGKLLAMTECGFKDIPDSTWFSRVLKPQMDKYPISYFLLWRNAETEHFGPVPNTPCGDDYTKAFKEAENVMFLEDIKD